MIKKYIVTKYYTIGASTTKKPYFKDGKSSKWSFEGDFSNKKLEFYL